MVIYLCFADSWKREDLLDINVYSSTTIECIFCPFVQIAGKVGGNQLSPHKRLKDKD